MQLPSALLGLSEPSGATAATSNSALKTAATPGLLNFQQLMAPGVTSNLAATAVPPMPLIQALEGALDGKTLPQDWQQQIQQLTVATPDPQKAMTALVQWIEALPDKPLSAPAAASPMVGVKESAKSVKVLEIPMESGDILTLPVEFPQWPEAEQHALLSTAGIAPEQVKAIVTSATHLPPAVAVSDEAQKIASLTADQVAARVTDALPKTFVLPASDSLSASTEALKQWIQAARPSFDVHQLRDALSRAVKQGAGPALMPNEAVLSPALGLSSVAPPLSSKPSSASTELPVTFAGVESKIETQMRVLSQRIQSAPNPTSNPMPSLPVELSDGAWLNKLAERAQLWMHEGKTEMRLRLDPSHLGQIELKFSQQGDQTQLQITATDARVRDALDSGQQRLREQLAQAGVELSQFDVNDHSQGRQQRQSGGSEAEATLTTAVVEDKDEVVVASDSQQLIDQRV